MSRRRWPWALALASIAIAFIVVAVPSPRVHADLENQQRGGEGGIYSSKPDRVGLVVPRGWHATDQASYPGVLLWMIHTQPDANMVLTAEPFTRRMYCSWDNKCRASHDPLTTQLACALRAKLKLQNMTVGAVQAGPKENEAAGIPTVWIEYDDGKHFLRQAVTLTDDRAVSLLLSTGSSEARTNYVRAFEQTLRTLHPLSEEESRQGTPAEPSGTAPTDAGVVDSVTLPDAKPAGLPTSFPSAPAAKQSPVGPCP